MKKTTKQTTLAGFFKKAPSVECRILQPSSSPAQNLSPSVSVDNSPISSLKKPRRKSVAEVSVEHGSVTIDDDDFVPSSRPRKRNKTAKIMESDDDYAASDHESSVNKDSDCSSSSAHLTTDSSIRKDTPSRVPASHPSTILSEFLASPQRPIEGAESNESLVQPLPITPCLKREASSRMSSHIKLQDKQERLVEEGYTWLKTGNIKDADGNKAGTPQYNPRTLYIPKSVSSRFSPFEAQFWELKSQNFDSVLFFQKGKFYELYEEDAVLAHQLFDWKMSSRGLRMAGVPDYTFDQWAAKFVAKGFRVARVDQMESILGKELRDRVGGKKDKIVRRELTQVLTQGTLVDESMLLSDMSTFVLSIKELECDTDFECPRFGVVFADTATGAFHYSSFKDDSARTKLDTLLSQIKPRELVLEKGQISPSSLKTIKSAVSPNTIYNYIKAESEFWDDERTAQELREWNYFGDSDEERWPEAVRLFVKDKTALHAFGGLLWYLRNLKLDQDLCSIGNFSPYDPLQRGSSLVLDGQSLINLEIFANTWNGGTEGTLFSILQRCITPFGKRLLHLWVCHPLQNPREIEERLNVIDFLAKEHEVRETIRDCCTKLPDLERMLSRLHCGRCKVADFLKVLEGCKRIVDLLDVLGPEVAQNSLLSQILSVVPDMHDKLAYWQSAFDWDVARSSKDENGKTVAGIIVPTPGAELDFDDSQRLMEEIESRFEPLIKQYRKDLNSSKLNYRNLGQSKEIYQIEVPSSLAVPRDWNQLSSTKAVTRYWSPAVAKCVRELLEAQEMHKTMVEGLQTRFYKRFDEDYGNWTKLTKAIANIDCLYSLTLSSMSLAEPSCRPLFLDANTESANLAFKELRHPCAGDDAATNFIPNDIRLGGESQNMSLLTGPNMAGKSTLLRSLCIGVVLAHLGHYVPAASARLTPIDQVFVRTGGARDNIAGSQSTFMVELNETSTILSNATPRSLVILDELGRGTSTHDGTAIAYSVLHHLATYTGCLGFFSTHYGSLSTEFLAHPDVKMSSMSYLIDAAHANVTFLYKLIEGPCSHSHGLNVARMAGLPEPVIDRARIVSEQFEAAQAEKKKRKKMKTTIRNGTVEYGDGRGGVDIRDHDGNEQVLPLAVEMDLERLYNMVGNASDAHDGEVTKEQMMRIFRHVERALVAS